MSTSSFQNREADEKLPVGTSLFWGAIAGLCMWIVFIAWIAVRLQP